MSITSKGARDNLYMRTPHHHMTPANQRPLSVYMEILGVKEPLDNPAFFQEIKDALSAYPVSEINIHGGLNAACECFEIPGYDALPIRPNAQLAKKLTALFRALKQMGVKIVLSGGEPRLPEGFFDAYPQARNVTNGLLYSFFELRTQEIFRIFPNVDEVQFHLFETGLLNDQDIFRELHWANDSGTYGSSLYTRYIQIHTIADYIAEIITAFSRGAQSEGKAFSLLTFCHYPYQERLVIDALKTLDPRMPVILDHKCQPGDWDPFRPANNVMLEITDRGDSKMKFDGVGEYWGQGLHPYCYPEEIQARLIHALEKNPSIAAVGMRVHWEYDRTLFGKPDEINWYALCRLAKDPYTPIETIWSDWAVSCFGKKAAEKVIFALQRSQRIVNLTHYIRGAWAQRHSHIAPLDYFMAQILHTGRAQMEWTPNNFLDNMLLRDIMLNPREHNIETVLEDRYEALRLVTLSIADIEDARRDLSEDSYAMLSQQFARLKIFVEMCIPHVEAGLRCMMQMVNPSDENKQKVQAPLRALTVLARQFESGELAAHPLILLDVLQKYVCDVKAHMEEH